MTHDTDNLGAQLRRLGDSADVPPDSAARVGAALGHRRRRRRMTVAGASAAAVAVVIGSVALVNRPDSTDPGVTNRGDGVVDTGSSWQSIAPSPLQPRHGAISAWTGTEMLVIGGVTGPPCPPNADCAGPSADEIASDGAAYNPDTDSWHKISTAPHGLANGQSLWIGDRLLVFDTDGTVLSYAPATDTWRTVSGQVPEGYPSCSTWTGQYVVCLQSEERARYHDWLLDPGSGEWTQIPDDPFPSTFDRSLTWTGHTLYFTGLLSSGISSDEPEYYQFATYDIGSQTWAELDESPVGFWSPTWFWFDDHLVNPTQEAVFDDIGPGHPSPGAAYDPRYDTWSAIAQTEMSWRDVIAGCQLPTLGVAGDWLVGGGFDPRLGRAARHGVRARLPVGRAVHRSLDR